MSYPIPLSDFDVSFLERATLDAVAPSQIDELEGWLLPFDASTIGRAKSAVPVRHHTIRANTLDTIQHRYEARGLPPIFRIAEVPNLRNLTDALKHRGYAPHQPTMVQVGSVHTVASLPSGSPVVIHHRPTVEWSAVYIAPGFDPVDGANRVRALSRSPCVHYAVISEEDAPAAAGTLALSQGWASIHGMRTVIQHRGKELAARILSGLARHALSMGIERVFLQVEEGNAAALSLYRRAGFTTAWRYHYWRRP
jgi:GNAT superfamily N-acetyltransferase